MKRLLALILALLLCLGLVSCGVYEGESSSSSDESSCISSTEPSSESTSSDESSTTESSSETEELIKYYEIIYQESYTDSSISTNKFFTNRSDLTSVFDIESIDVLIDDAFFEENYIYAFIHHIGPPVKVVGFYDFKYKNESSYLKSEVKESNNSLDQPDVMNTYVCCIVIPKSEVLLEPTDMTSNLEIYLVGMENIDQDASIFEGVYW